MLMNILTAQELKKRAHKAPGADGGGDGARREGTDCC